VSRGERDDLLPALRALGDSLGEAARREIGPDAADAAGEPRRAFRRFGGRGGLLGLVAGSALVVAGAATAGDLISSGEPEDAGDVPAQVRPVEGSSTPIALRAADPEAGGAWGLRAYRSTGGLACVTAGWIRGQSLGRVEDGRFRAFPPDDPGTASACGPVRPGAASFSFSKPTEPAGRTLVFGRAGDGVRRVEVLDGEQRHVATVSGGAWLVVLDASVDPGRLAAKALRP
jgi:hypothetical protein